MKRHSPGPPLLTLTGQTRGFVADVYRRAREAGRETAIHADWLVTALRAGHPYLISHLVRQLVAPSELSALIVKVETAERAGDAWLIRDADRFIDETVVPVARELGHGYVGTEHVLLAITRAPGPVGDNLRRAGLTRDRAHAAFDAIEWGSA